MLDAKAIKELLKFKHPDAQIMVFDSVDSTNTCAKNMKDISKGIICARAQTAGRGRHGRSFYSPADTGLYMSIILPITPQQAYEFSLTAAAAVASARAISKLCGIEVQIKWVNDLYINNKKVAGILTEADKTRVIVGIGINVCTELFPADLPRAGSLNSNLDFSCLAAKVAEEIFDIVCSFDKSFMDEYRKRSMLLGKQICYTQNNQTKYATAIDIDDNGRLIVRDRRGTEIGLNSGEVSIVL